MELKIEMNNWRYINERLNYNIGGFNVYSLGFNIY